jgi:ParB family chromosome partitioning protein
MKPKEIKRKLIPIEQLLPNPWNPNKTSTRVDEAIRESIGTHGFIIPIVVRPHPTNDFFFQVVDGEHRLEAAQEMGLDSIPAEVVSLNDAEAKKFTIIANETRGKAEPVALAELLEEIQNESDSPLLGLPYYEKEIQQMMAEAQRLMDEPLYSLETPQSEFRVVLRYPSKGGEDFKHELKKWISENFPSVQVYD